MLTAPDPEPCVAAPPDFVGVGSERCGTTRWYELLTAHPEVYHHPTRGKELHFFENSWLADLGPNQVSDYHQILRRPGGMIAGEWTPRYMYDHWVLPQLAQAAPDACILVLLRDPATRYLSGLQRSIDRHAVPSSKDGQEGYEKSMYSVQLARLLRWFPRQRIQILQYELCCLRPREALASTLEFVGLSDSAMNWSSLDEVINARVDDPPELPARIRRAMSADFRADFERLDALFPGSIDPNLWPSVRSDSW